MNKLYRSMAKTAQTMPKCEVCNMFATVEWKAMDEDGTYYTYRCEDHPCLEETYYPAELR